MPQAHGCARATITMDVLVENAGAKTGNLHGRTVRIYAPAPTVGALGES